MNTTFVLTRTPPSANLFRSPGGMGVSPVFFVRKMQLKTTKFLREIFASLHLCIFASLHLCIFAPPRPAFTIIKKPMNSNPKQPRIPSKSSPSDQFPTLPPTAIGPFTPSDAIRPYQLVPKPVTFVSKPGTNVPKPVRNVEKCRSFGFDFAPDPCKTSINWLRSVQQNPPSSRPKPLRTGNCLNNPRAANHRMRQVSV